ncbi:hypothetical protein M6B38_156695 [Iris pallida]|uniref:Uncharacterized protein n=1 Tax=Iris pallida TaxID=29817 RepID=A0AAX6F3I8_IRIPA|nr:hypothetical protein M6B38_156695 [Iris pallida]
MTFKLIVLLSHQLVKKTTIHKTSSDHLSTKIMYKGDQVVKCKSTCHPRPPLPSLSPSPSPLDPSNWNLDLGI